MKMRKTNAGNPSAANAAEEWGGYTLDELRMKRAMAAIKTEIGKERISSRLSQAKSQVEEGGIRSMIFSGNVLSGLKTVDYVILGYKTSKLAWRLWNKLSGRRR